MKTTTTINTILTRAESEGLHSPENHAVTVTDLLSAEETFSRGSSFLEILAVADAVTFRHDFHGIKQSAERHTWPASFGIFEPRCVS